MGKKWYNLFVSVEGEAEAAPEAPGSAARTVAEIAASIEPQPAFTAPVANPGSFDEIYGAANIQKPAHGYTIMKVADMLQSERLRGLPAEVKRSSILVALDAAGVPIDEVIQDAVRRDRALDTYENVLEKSATDAENRAAEDNRKLQAELEKIMADYRSRIQANNDAAAKEKDRFFAWRLQKQQEEKKIADAVSYFVSENPITVDAAARPAAPKTPAR
jgi:ElaB/YqjD/DUF883 family membrane-anchored ribosome-binding protein